MNVVFKMNNTLNYIIPQIAEQIPVPLQHWTCLPPARESGNPACHCPAAQLTHGSFKLIAGQGSSDEIMAAMEKNCW